MDQTETLNDPPVAGSLLPIRTVSNLTGVNPVTLRAWERRYGLITPMRTPKGHRLYSSAEVETIRQVLELLDQGISISQVKPLLGRAMLVPEYAERGDAGDVWEVYRQKMLAAVENFDESALNRVYDDAMSLYTVDVVSRQLTTPVLRALGMLWQERGTGIAEEHFFSVYLRSKLYTRIHHLNHSADGPILLLACLPGEYHDIGLLLFALSALDFGYRLLILGVNTPLDQLPDILEKRPCAGIVLSGASRPARGLLDRDLPELVRKATVPVFLGGITADKYRDRIEACGAITMGESIGDGLKCLNRHLRQPV